MIEYKSELEKFRKMLDRRKYVKECIGEAALYEQMAEECTELAQVLLKKARRLRGDNPTPLTMDEINANIEEEYTDVFICSTMLDIQVNNDLYDAKILRWAGRVDAK
jgi:NTP pyrophosphatase (non-canonical NTP hydrolase)